METRLEKLKALEAKLKAAMEYADNKTLAALARQYRETLREIEELYGAKEDDDEISAILARREADGEPGAVRKNRA